MTARARASGPPRRATAPRDHQLSGGQQQRVALARAVVYDPARAPDGRTARRARQEASARRCKLEIKHIQQQLGTTVIYVTHDQAEALTMADRIAVLQEGLAPAVRTAPDRGLRAAQSNAFVAGFVGETNFIVGTIDSGAATGPGVLQGRRRPSQLPVGPRGPSTPALADGSRDWRSDREHDPPRS